MSTAVNVGWATSVERVDRREGGERSAGSREIVSSGGVEMSAIDCC